MRCPLLLALLVLLVLIPAPAAAVRPSPADLARLARRLNRTVGMHRAAVLLQHHDHLTLMRLCPPTQRQAPSEKGKTSPTTQQSSKRTRLVYVRTRVKLDSPADENGVGPLNIGYLVEIEPER